MNKRTKALATALIPALMTGCVAKYEIRDDVNSSAIIATTMVKKATEMRTSTNSTFAGFSPEDVLKMYEAGTFSIPFANASKYSACNDADTVCKISNIRTGLEKLVPENVKLDYTLCENDYCKADVVKNSLMENGFHKTNMKYAALKYAGQQVEADANAWAAAGVKRETGRYVSLGILLGLLSGSSTHNATSQSSSSTSTWGSGSTTGSGGSLVQ